MHPRDFQKIVLKNDTELFPDENIHSSLVGMATEYLTRYMTGTPVDTSFAVSLLGASIADESAYAQKLASEITGLDDVSIRNACKLVGYDCCFRAGMSAYKPVQEIEPSADTLFNIRTMVERCLRFWNEYGPIVKSGFTFEGGYTAIVSSGDGDFLTKDTIWDFKVSKNAITNKQTLQLLMYYIMGCHSTHEEFCSIKRLGIFNPRLNTIYLLDLATVDTGVIEEVSSEVIGYK